LVYESHASFESRDTFEHKNAVEGSSLAVATANRGAIRLPHAFAATLPQGQGHSPGQGRFNWPAAMRIAILDGQRVAVKTVYKHVVNLSTDIIIEMNEVCYMYHPLID
jgi:hypothetical protein